uniref:Helicase-associated domain-containing protein n=1 Tax=Piliocolobus tephrosceles TaxID=591936 RepID=A0A8C9GS15_9PRIM
MAPFLIPEIFRSDLTQIYLELKTMNIKNPLEFNFLENPKKEMFIYSAKILFKINAIDVNNNLTDIGKKLCLLPLHPVYASMLLCSIQFECIDEMATIVALLNTDTIFLNYNFYESLDDMHAELDTAQGSSNPNDNNKLTKNEINNKSKKVQPLDDKNNNIADEKEYLNESKINDKNKLINVARRKLIHPDGDHLTLLYIFYLWTGETVINEKKHFCYTYGLNNERLKQVEKIKIQLLEILQNKMNIKITTKLHLHNWDKILMCLCKSCFFNIAKSTSSTNVFINLVNKAKIRIHPSSTMFNSSIKPSFILYSDVVQTKLLYARMVTKVEGEWLLKYASQNFKLIKQ